MHTKSSTSRNKYTSRQFRGSFAFIALTLAAFSQSAFAYDKATVTNKTQLDVKIVIDYPGCKSDTFTVAAGKSAQPSAARGGCLISSISGTFVQSSLPITTYKSSGTSYSNFILVSIPERGIGYRIFSDHELDAELAQGPKPPFYNLQKPRPFYIIGHNPNQIPIPGHPDWATEDEVVGDLKAGANALEPDIMKFSDKAAYKTGKKINDSAGPSGLFIYHDSVDVTTHMPATVEAYFKYVHDLIRNDKYNVALFVIDVKPPAYDYGPALVKAIHDNLVKDGVNPWLIYNTGDTTDKAIKFLTDIAPLLSDHEGICIDGTRDPVTIYNKLAGITKNHNIAFGTGGQGFTSGSFPHVSLAVDEATWIRTGQGLNASVPYVFPVPSANTAGGIDWWESFINAGVDGLIPDLDVNPAPPGSTRALISALKKKVEARQDYYLAIPTDNPFNQGHEGYALRVDTGHNGTASGGTDGNVIFVLTGTKGTAAAIFDGRTSVGSETRFHDNGRDYLVIPSKDLGKLTSLKIYVTGSVNHSWIVKQAQISSALFGIPYANQPDIAINQTVTSSSPVTVPLEGKNLGRP